MPAASDLQGLARLDSNRDGIIDASDMRFGELRIWVDANGNGASDAGELHELAELGLASFNLKDATALAAQTLKLGSNALLATSTFARTDGTAGTLGDVSLAYKPGKVAATSNALSSVLASRAGLASWFADNQSVDPDIEKAIAALSAGKDASALSIFDLPSDRAAFDALVSGTSTLSQTGSSAAANASTSSKDLATLFTAVGDKGYTVTPLTDVAEASTDSARLLALLRQDMAAFGTGMGLDSREWKGLANRAFEFM